MNESEKSLYPRLLEDLTDDKLLEHVYGIPSDSRIRTNDHVFGLTEEEMQKLIDFKQKHKDCPEVTFYERGCGFGDCYALHAECKHCNENICLTVDEF